MPSRDEKSARITASSRMLDVGDLCQLALPLQNASGTSTYDHSLECNPKRVRLWGQTKSLVRLRTEVWEVAAPS